MPADSRLDPEIAEALERMPETPLDIDGARAAHLAGAELMSGPGEPVAEVRRTYLGTDLPASTLLVVAGLAQPDYLLEIEGIAVVD